MDKAKIWIGSLEELFQHDFEKKAHFGYVYAVELDHGVKIGRTENPHQRMSQLQTMFERYGDRKMIRIAVSPIHVNYSQNETSLLSTFGYIRKSGTEMTGAPFDFVVGAMESLKYNVDYDYKPDEKALEGLKDLSNNIWGVSESTAKTILDCSDGLNEIKIKVGNYGYWWVVLNSQSLSMTRDAVLDFIVWYALHRDVWRILEYWEYLANPDDEYFYADEPVTKWMLDAISEYCGEIVINAIWSLLREKLTEYESKYELYVRAMYKVAKERGYECSLPPNATYEQIINEDYDGLEPIDPATLR